MEISYRLDYDCRNDDRDTVRSFNMNFENAPFKLTREYVDLLGGVDSTAFKTFEDLFVRGFFILQKHQEAICALVEVCKWETVNVLYVYKTTNCSHPFTSLSSHSVRIILKYVHYAVILWAATKICCRRPAIEVCNHPTTLFDSSA